MKCYICGKDINVHKLHYCVGPNSYVCGDKECYHTYYWDILAAKFVTDHKHEYVVVDNVLYQIDESYTGFGDKEFYIQFEDGYFKLTSSLFRLSEIPESRKHIFKTNAHFIQRSK